MKVLFINTNIGYGGASKMMAFVANTLSDKGHDVTFLTYRNDTVLQTLLPTIKIQHKNWETDNNNYLLTIPKTVLKLHKYLKRNGFDVAVAFLSPSQLRLSLAGIGTKTKLLFSQRGDPYRSNGKGFINKLTNYAFLRADLYVFQTKGAQVFYSKKIQKRSVVIPNPIKKFDGGEVAHQRDKRIVNVARLDIYQKRQDVLIQAFKLFAKEFPEYSLHFYGDGPDEGKLMELAGNDSNIIFHGAVESVSERINSAGIFILSSDFEGIPNALMEAMSLGIPCISTRCSPGGAELLIENGHNGLLVDCGNVEKLYKAMKYMAENPEEAQIMGNNATIISKTYSEKNISAMWLDLFEAIQNGEC